MSEINFVSSAVQADVIEIGLDFLSIGRTSITFRCEVRNLFTKKTIISIEKIVFVNVNEQMEPWPHGQTLETITQNAVFI
jgi:acyl-CoA hydrolase